MVQHHGEHVVGRSDAEHLARSGSSRSRSKGRRWAVSIRASSSASAQSVTVRPGRPRPPGRCAGTARRRARAKTVRSASCRACDVPQRGPQRVQVEGAAQPEDEREVVRDAAAGEPVHQPQPPLRRRERDALGPCRPAACDGRAGGRARRPRGPRAAPGVGASNRSRMASSAPSSVRARLISRVASSEWPPRSKKSSSAPTSGSPSTSAKRRQSTSSCGVRGPRPVPSATAGSASGRARTSSLPLAFSGSRSRVTKAAGTM